MGAALFVTLQKKLPDVDTSDMNGKAIADQIDNLDRIAKKLKLKPLSDFVSASQEDMDDLLGDEDWEEDLEENQDFVEQEIKKSKGKDARDWKEIQGALKGIEDMLGKVEAAGPVEEEWFDPSSGLKTVKSLLDHVRAQPKSFGKNAEHLVQDLEDVERFLELAKKHGTRFHFCWDI